MNKKYIFRITLKDSPLCHKHPSRDIEILPQKSLYYFAEKITDSFNFDLDHCFGFYDDNLLRMYDSKDMYELFADLPDVEETEGAKSVKKTKIEKLWKKPGDKKLFYFDYGDGWAFSVKLLVIKESKNIKTQVVRKYLDSPDQYPPCDE